MCLPAGLRPGVRQVSPHDHRHAQGVQPGRDPLHAPALCGLCGASGARQVRRRSAPRAPRDHLEGRVPRRGEGSLFQRHFFFCSSSSHPGRPSPHLLQGVQGKVQRLRHAFLQEVPLHASGAPQRWHRRRRYVCRAEQDDRVCGARLRLREEDGRRRQRPHGTTLRL
uniref:Secreted protein n=1 Tax=Steinernema glaseri TaxID=37863 RepID=A0A1I7ZX34_9BILA